jgi:hypothetical protein
LGLIQIEICFNISPQSPQIEICFNISPQIKICLNISPQIEICFNNPNKKLETTTISITISSSKHLLPHNNFFHRVTVATVGLLASLCYASSLLVLWFEKDNDEIDVTATKRKSTETTVKRRLTVKLGY